MPLQFVENPANTISDDSSSGEELSLNENDAVECVTPHAPKRLNGIFTREQEMAEDLENQFDEPAESTLTPEKPESGPTTPCGDITTPPACPLAVILTPGRFLGKPTAIQSENEGVNETESQVIPELVSSSEKMSKDKGQMSSNQLSPGESLNLAANDHIEKTSSLIVTNTKNNPDEGDACRSCTKAKLDIFSGITDVTPQRPKRNGFTILVFDTPEDEYGLTARQRILKKYRKQKTKS